MRLDTVILRLLAATLILMSLQAHAQNAGTVTIEVFPPEARIQAFFPTSPPQEGDAILNGVPFETDGKTLDLPLRLSAPGYGLKDVQAALVAETASSPGVWHFHYELAPIGIVSIISHEFRRHPGRSYGALAVAILALTGTGLFLTRTLRADASAARAAKRTSEIEATAAKDRLAEVDPEIVGRTIDSYEILSLLGEGAFAKVYKAKHVEYGDMFALKMLRAELLDQSVGERVEREMAIGRDLVHPNLVRAFGYGTFRDAPYLVLEYIEGQPLDERLAEGRPDIRETLRILRKIAEGLQYAHGKGVIHRDLKPANLFITPGDGVKLLDFGVAKILDSERRLTLTGQALGTPHYMSPEQARGRAGVGSDIYAMGAIAFEMLTGEPPFDGDTALEVLTSHTFSEVPSARSLNPAVSPELDALLVKMMAKAPGDRPHNMAEVIRALDEVPV